MPVERSRTLRPVCASGREVVSSANYISVKSIVYSEHGSPDLLQLRERALPLLNSGEVRVRVAVSGVNPTDWKARDRWSSNHLGWEQVPNQDGAGVIDSVSSDVSGLYVGDRVWIWDAAWNRPTGTAQEYVCLPARHVMLLPKHTSFDVGASLGIPALTAYRALSAFEHSAQPLGPGRLTGRRVLVRGGAGAVGHAAIQLAKWAGAEVISTVSSPTKAIFAWAAGADHVLNYLEQDVLHEVRLITSDGVDLIIEVDPIANIAEDARIIASNGTVSIYVSDESELLPVPLAASMWKNVRYQFIVTFTVTEEQKDSAVAGVQRALEDGVLGVGAENGLPLHRYSLESASEAHDASRRGIVGKVLIDVWDPPETGKPTYEHANPQTILRSGLPGECPKTAAKGIS